MYGSNHLHVLAFICLMLASASCSGEGTARSDVRLAEVEVQTQSGNSVDLWRAEFKYQANSDSLREIAFSSNGNPAGHIEVGSTRGRVALMRLVHPAGHSADMGLDYDEDGRIRTRLYRVPQVYTEHETFSYEAAGDDRPREVVALNTPARGEASTSYIRFSYDGAHRLNEISRLHGGGTLREEIRYDDDDRVIRVTHYLDTLVTAIFRYEYGQAGRLQSVVDNNSNALWDVSYDSDGYISEIRRIEPGTGEVVTIAYRYESGSVKGVTFEPDLPHPGLFDMSGRSFTSVDFLTKRPAALNAFVPAPPGGGDPTGNGDNGGSDICQGVLCPPGEHCAVQGGEPVCVGSGEACAGLSPNPADPCQLCLYAHCCDEVELCVYSGDCDSMYSCMDSSCDSVCD